MKTKILRNASLVGTSFLLVGFVLSQMMGAGLIDAIKDSDSLFLCLGLGLSLSMPVLGLIVLTMELADKEAGRTSAPELVTALIMVDVFGRE